MGTHPIFESDFDCLTGQMTLVRAARLLTRVTVRPLAVSSVRNVDPNRPGSFLNGPDGRKMERVPTIGPVVAEEGYVSHEYYNHDKVYFQKNKNNVRRNQGRAK